MKATWVIDAQRRAEERYRRLTNWHRWFAWRPVWVAVNDCRWLETVERKCEFFNGADGGFVQVQYAPIQPLKGE